MKKLYLLLSCIVITISAETKIIYPEIESTNTFAIVIDRHSFDLANAGVNAYKKSIEQQGLGTFVLVDDWQKPEQVRSAIIKLYEREPYLEGVVFIGDIPIAMLRDAQHLTSAFKIDQKNPRFSLQRTSVPSDRFYDDFDLRFDFVQQDTSDQMLFYYSLRADSPQKIRSEIYSARIKAPAEDTTKYELLNNYLLRIAEQKMQSQILNNALVFTGHGYHSEALDAWAGAQLRYREQFPNLFGNSGKITWLNHAMRPDIKSVILRELQKPELDMAIFHAHGGEDTQYLLGFEPAGSLTENIDAIKLFLRSKLRSAKRRDRSLEETKQGYIDRHGIPEIWFEYAFDDSVTRVDSLLYASQDIYFEDIGSINPQPRFIYFDECFNGAFIHTNYIANKYLFGGGKTIVTAANSVNVRQDIWATEFLGLLNYGMRVGNWLKLQNSLELHLHGDPTFQFNNRGNLNFASLLNQKNIDENILLRWLSSNEIPLQVLAVDRLAAVKDADFETRLIEIYNSASSHNVRFQALKWLAQFNTKQFEQILFKSIKDQAEIIRRFSAFWMGDIGSEVYLPVLVESYFWDASARVRYNAKDAINKIGPLKALNLCDGQLNAIKKYAPVSNTFYIMESLKRSNEWLYDDLLKRLNDRNEKLKKRISAVRTFRNYRFHEALPQLINVTSDSSAPLDLRITLLEMLGWFSMSVHRADIVAACKGILEDENTKGKIYKEALKTINRIEQGLNNPITP